MRFLDPENLMRLAKQARPAFENAKPFPHVVIDGLFFDGDLRKIARALPLEKGLTERQDIMSSGKTQYRGDSLSLLSVETRQLLLELNSRAFVKFLSELTGAGDLISDPELRSGGVHQIKKSGFVKIHADFNWHEKLRAYRRLNVILYLNESWRDEYGGHLELWDAQMTKCVSKIAPHFNRLVVFKTSETSFHGHPEPLACPEDRVRNSIALYYYSKKVSDDVRKNVTTIYRERPSERLRRFQKNAGTKLSFEPLKEENRTFTCRVQAGRQKEFDLTFPREYFPLMKWITESEAEFSLEAAISRLKEMDNSRVQTERILRMFIDFNIISERPL